MRYSNRKRLTIEVTNRKEMACSASVFLGLLRTMSAIAESIKGFVTKELFVIDVVLKLLRKRYVEKEWAISNWLYP